MQGLARLAEYDYVAIFDADFKPDTDFLVSDTAHVPDVMLLMTSMTICGACWFCNSHDCYVAADTDCPLPD